MRYLELFSQGMKERERDREWTYLTWPCRVPNMVLLNEKYFFLFTDVCLQKQKQKNEEFENKVFLIMKRICLLFLEKFGHIKHC